MALLASPALDLEVDIPPATPARVAALRRRMEARFHDQDASAFEQQNLAQDIITTHHAGLTPLAWQMIERPNATYDVAGLIDFVAGCAESPDEVDGRLVRLVKNPNWDEEWAVYGFWKGRGTDLRPVVWQRLTDACSPWKRIFTYMTFPRRCTKEWKARLFSDLHECQRPLAPSKLDKLLTDLDSADFEVREKATDELVYLGERVEPSLRGLPTQKLSPEQGWRVRTVLETLREQKRPPDCVRALEYLGSHDAPENGELLQVLADGVPGAWLTQQAKAKLAEWRRNRGLSDK